MVEGGAEGRGGSYAGWVIVREDIVAVAEGYDRKVLGMLVLALEF